MIPNYTKNKKIDYSYCDTMKKNNKAKFAHPSKDQFNKKRFNYLAI